MKKHIATLIFLLGSMVAFLCKYGNKPLSIITLSVAVIFTAIWAVCIVLEGLILVKYYIDHDGKKIILRYKDLKTYIAIEPDEYKFRRSWVVFVLVVYMNTFYIYFPTIFDYIRALSLSDKKDNQDKYMIEYLKYVDRAVQRKLQQADDEIRQAQEELNRVNTNLSSTLKNRTNQELKGR